MALTEEDKRDVYESVSIEMVRMFDRLANLYRRPDQSEQAEFLKEVESDLRKCSEHFKLPE